MTKTTTARVDLDATRYRLEFLGLNHGPEQLEGLLVVARRLQ